MPWRHVGGRRGGFEGCLISPIEGEEATAKQFRSSFSSRKSSIKGPEVSLRRCLITIISSALLSSSKSPIRTPSISQRLRIQHNEAHRRPRCPRCLRLRGRVQGLLQHQHERRLQRQGTYPTLPLPSILLRAKLTHSPD